MNFENINRIVVTGDNLRPTALGQYHNQIENIRWLYNLIKFQLSQASSMPIDVVHNKTQFEYLQQFGDDVKAVSYQDWGRVFEVPTQNMRERLANDFSNSLVIGYELPLSMKEVFNDQGVPYIDVMLHPIRFMDDIFMCFKSNIEDVNREISAYEVAKDEVYMAAGVIMATVARHKRKAIGMEDCILYAAQTKNDRSMISNGQFMSSELIAELVTPYILQNNILYKDHPLDKTPVVREQVKRSAKLFDTTSDNIYQLLCSDEISSVISVSSSVCHEAEFFGKRSLYLKGLSTPVRYRGENRTHESYSVYDAFLSTDFWRAILSPIVQTTPKDGYVPPRRPNFLRKSLGLYWGYNIFACDPIVENASATPFKDLPRVSKLMRMSEVLLSHSSVDYVYKGLKRIKNVRR